MNQLYYGDNLQVLREHIADEAVDLIYLGPPFTRSAITTCFASHRKGVTSEAQSRLSRIPGIGTSTQSASLTSCCISQTQSWPT